ncbi:DUF4194 domain-containing protein [Arthrobacter sulfonylureivorans]|uniref:DUF4194 domain-containing protein n=1 Tax=Arthrobacter sulfonylureivorans TaxID=2486855 RepID=A0ABY3W311_9MICC|nr:DUF4194 domain-containing protein [Arthrobacter sulfonylureivorans]UNK44472.1 DUF4194 domain-containing protein [Arthrobacter sulfonylureivorans]
MNEMTEVRVAPDGSPHDGVPLVESPELQDQGPDEWAGLDDRAGLDERTGLEEPDEREAPARDEVRDGPALFDGDTGTLPLKLRQALIRLLRGPYLDAGSTDRVYDTVVEHRWTLASRLSELFLQLVIDEDRKVAMLRQVPMAEPHTTALQRQRDMTREETLLLLRMRLVQDRHAGTGTEPLISRADVIDVLQDYVDPEQRDAKHVEDLADASIRKLANERRLLQATELPDVWVISPALPLALPFENIGDIPAVIGSLAGEDLPADGAPETDQLAFDGGEA